MSRPVAKRKSASVQLARERITQVLERKGVTYAVLERKFDYSAGYFSKVMTGTRLLTRRHIAEIALLTGVDPHWLETGEGSPRLAEDSASYDLTRRPAPASGGPCSPGIVPTVVYVCASCRGQVAPEALVCPHCRTDLSRKRSAASAEQVEEAG